MPQHRQNEGVVGIGRPALALDRPARRGLGENPDALPALETSRRMEQQRAIGYERIQKSETLVNIEDQIAPLEEIFRLQNAKELVEAERRYLSSS